MVNNYDKIKSLMTFDDDGDSFYFVQIMRRKKENPDNKSNARIIKTYYINREKYLDSDFGEMKVLADYHNARVYINLNKRRFSKMGNKTCMKILGQIDNGSFSSIPTAFSSVTGAMKPYGEKIWIVDYDEMDLVKLEKIKEYIESLSPDENGKSKIVDVIPTKNGYHLLTTSFRVDMFKKKYPEIDIKKNNGTILYTT